MDIHEDILSWIINFDLGNYTVDLKPELQDYLHFPPLSCSNIIVDTMTESSRCYDKNGYLIYEGQVVDKKREGQGIEYAKDGKGIKYEGFFENDRPVLKNRQIYNENNK